MKVNLALLVTALISAQSAQAAWPFSPSNNQQVAPPNPASTPQPAAPIPAQNPQTQFTAQDNDVVDHDSAPLLSAPVVSSSSSSPASPTPTPFTGTEYKFGNLRIRPSELQYESAALLLLLLYALSSLSLARSNRAHAKRWFDAHSPAFAREFAAFGVGDGPGSFKKDGGDEFVLYATGRRAVQGVQVNVRTVSNDLLVTAYEVLRGQLDLTFKSQAGKVVLDFRLRQPTGTPGAKFCFALVKRHLLRSIRDDRWDLRTFTNTTEFQGLPSDLIAMTESGDVTNVLLKSADSGLLDAVKPGTEGAEYFESLVISDMPAGKPDEYKPELPQNEYNLVLTLRLPPKGKVEETKSFIHLAANLADILVLKDKLIPAIGVTKLVKRRAEVLATLLKPLEDEKREIEQEKREDFLAAKRKVELEREEAKLSKMSQKERIAYQEKKKEVERKKLMLKMGKKQQKGGGLGM
ncbi:DUF1682-domain-containing protein [Meredithblackwellia eburnea MCA 4105]